MYYVVCTRLLLNFKMVCTHFQNYFTQQRYHLSIYYLKLGNKNTIQNFQFQLYFYSFYQEVFCILQHKIETKCGSLKKMNLKFISLNNRQDWLEGESLQGQRYNRVKSHSKYMSMKMRKKEKYRKNMLEAISPILSGKITKDHLQESCKISPYIMLTHTRSSTSIIFANRGMNILPYFWYLKLVRWSSWTIFGFHLCSRGSCIWLRKLGHFWPFCQL